MKFQNNNSIPTPYGESFTCVGHQLVDRSDEI